MKRDLTDAFIRKLKASTRPYIVADTQVPGLKVRVSPQGGKSFILWRRLHRSRSSAVALSLGKVGELELTAARAKARTWIELIKSGRDPRDVTRAAAADNFGRVMEDFIARHVAGQRRAKQVEREIRKELLPRWRNRPVADISRRDVIAMLDEIKDRDAVHQAHNIFSHAKTFFNWCVAKDILVASPCDRLKPKTLIGTKLHRQRVLTDAELASFWQATSEMGYPYGVLFQILLLSGARKNEIAQAKWSEIDLPNRLLTVPAERFKSGNQHLIPLSADAMALLEQLPRWSDGELLFSLNGRRPLAAFSAAKAKLDKLMGDPPDWVTHDLRRTVRTRLSSLRIPDVVAEQVIGHGRVGLQRVYDQHRFVDEMREALELWASRLRTIIRPSPVNVVPLRAEVT
jgi:integrase